MSRLPPFSIRYAVLVALTLVVALGGIARGQLAVAEMAPGAGGLTLVICHADTATSADRDGSGGSANHTCCDDCALCAAVVLPAAPSVSEPAQVAFAAGLAVGISPAPVMSLARTPRLSQGPPIA